MGTTVKVVVSKGIEEATVPDVKGKSQRRCNKITRRRKLKVSNYRRRKQKNRSRICC